MGNDKFRFNAEGFDADGYDKNGLDAHKRSRDGYDYYGFKTDGAGNRWNRDGFNPLGYNAQGYNRAGFDRRGFNAQGIDRDGFNESGYDVDGYDRCGHDKDGLLRGDTSGIPYPKGAHIDGDKLGELLGLSVSGASGFEELEITLANGRVVRIGYDGEGDGWAFEILPA